MNKSLSNIKNELTSFRKILESNFSNQTAFPETIGDVPSAGHCAVVAILVQAKFGGSLVSTSIKGESHWFNRLTIDSTVIDVDLTGDQYGFPCIQIQKKGELYLNCRIRIQEDLNTETLARAQLLADRSKLKLELLKNQLSTNC